MMTTLLRSLAAVVASAAVASPAQMPTNTLPPPPSAAAAAGNPFMELMQRAWRDGQAHGGTFKPVLSPLDATVLNKEVPVLDLAAAGFRVVPWTTNDPAKMHELIRMGVSGIITDYPDRLRQALREERAASTTFEQKQYLDSFDVAAHRGGRGLRPENTLPSFESGLDQMSTTLETDTGVTTDRVSLISHDQFLNPESCRRADGTPYTMANRVYVRDISMTDAQKMFVCDKLHAAFPEQRNDLSLSPAAVAFAKKEGMPSPYAPTHAAQLIRFARFYAEYYGTGGAGAGAPHAAERAANASKVRFNIETKIIPDNLPPAVLHELAPGAPAELLVNHTVAPQVFVDVLVGAIKAEHAEMQAEIQSFDFRTLLLVQAQHPEIPTFYLTGSPALLSTEFVPASLRSSPAVAR